VRLANHLDKIGHRDLADRLDGVLKTAQEVGLIDTESELEFEKEAAATLDLKPNPEDPFTEEDVAEETAAEVGDEPVANAVDALASNDVSGRINKMADLISREFTTGVLGSFQR
jgi:hypothetical protein